MGLFLTNVMCRPSERESKWWGGKFVLPFVAIVKKIQGCFCSVSLKRRKAGRKSKISYHNYSGSELATLYLGSSSPSTPGKRNGSFQSRLKDPSSAGEGCCHMLKSELDFMLLLSLTAACSSRIQLLSVVKVCY